MPRISVYLPDELHKAVKAEQVPVSEVCQRALKAELEDRRQRKLGLEQVLWSDTNNHRRA